MDWKQVLESIVLGISGLIAFTIIGFIVYLIGFSLGFHSLRSGFVSEMNLIVQFPLFFVIVGLIKILIGGEIIDWVTRFISKILGIEILVNKTKKRKE
jgi:xanthosine utilization system XapX-like protein